VVAKALAKQPQHRYASAAEMSAAIDQALQRRASMAELMARAVPQRAPTDPATRPVLDPSGARLATASGWTMPDGQAPTALALDAIDAIPRDVELPPTRRRTVPPTRIHPDVPSTRMLPIRGVPITRTQLLLGGGALVVLIVIVAATRGGGATGPAVAATAGSAHVVPVVASATDPVAPALARASDLFANGDLEPALDVVTKARRAHPESAQLAYLDGKIYFAKLWWSDGVKAFRDAIHLDPAYGTDPELVKTVIRGFITTPEPDPKIEEFIRQDLRGAARSALEDTAKSHPNAAIRSRAAAELHRIP
ncbi:MAG: hypothetical protein ABI467_18275, partial [Kofleriaceae bacterium]